MQILRTPDDRFDALDDFPYAPRYTEITDRETGTVLRMAHVEAGPPDGPVALLLHGNPTWAYLYRKMIPGLAAAGMRVIVPDLIGCGRSDKPAAKADYTLARHYDWMADWIAANGLRDITLFCQDWGGTIGLAQVARTPERFARVIASNTGVPAGEGGNEMLRGWLAMMGAATAFPWMMLQQGEAVMQQMTAEILAAYRAPFPDPSYEAGICAFPGLIAIFPDNPAVALNREVRAGLARFEKPLLTLWGAKDIVAPGGDRVLQHEVPGAAGQPHHVFANAGHFTQEDVPAEMVERILAFAGKAG